MTEWGVNGTIYDGDDPELQAAWAKKLAVMEKMEKAQGNFLGFIAVAFCKRELREVDRKIVEIGRRAFRAAGPRQG